MPVDRTALPEVGRDPSFSFPRIERHRLANGMAVRTVEHRSAPVVSFVLQVKGGSGADESGREGVAALTGDILDEGTGELSAIDVSDLLARIGAEFDIDVGPDATTVTLTTLARFADRGARALADLTMRPSLRQDDFARVRQMRLDRLRQIRDLPAALAERAFLKVLYGAHPYGHLSIGTVRSLDAMVVGDVERCHAALFQPALATLVVVGDLPHVGLLATAERAFGGWAAGAGDAGIEEAVGAADVPVPLAPSARLVVIPRERAAQSHLRIGHLAARRGTPDYPALLVMNAVLGGQFVSRINLKLREEKGYTYGARTGFDWRLGPSPFSLEASVDTNATADAIADSLAELSAIRGSRPASEPELTLAKATLTRGYPRSFEKAQQVARSVCQLILYDLPDSYFESFVPLVSGVSSEDVTRAAARHLDPTKFATLIVGDQHAIEGSLGDLGLGDPIVLAPED
jgi:predicted Zn-dependent peptidase